MKNVPIADVRSFAIMGHTGSGKTTLTDAILYKVGINDRLGSVDNGSSLSDYTDEEKSRNISIFSTSFSKQYKGADGHVMGMDLIDTPGYMDFYGQVIAASRAVETGVITVDASSGVQVGTRRAWKLCVKQGIARAIVVTGLDRDNTDFEKTMADITKSFGDNCVPVVLPVDSCGGVIDVLGAKDIPEEIAEQVSAIKGHLVELAAETDDTLIEKYFGGEELSPKEIADGLRDSVAHSVLVPVFVACALKDVGIDALLDGISRLLPSPETREYNDSNGEPIHPGGDETFVGLVWRTVHDPFVGQLTFVRVKGGTITAESEVYNPVKKAKEKIGALLFVNGKKQNPIESAKAGDIIAIPKLKITTLGDTICAMGKDIICRNINFPKPVMFQAVTAKTQADEDKIGEALTRVCEDDPTLKVERDKDTTEVILEGLGDVHIDVAVGLMKRRSNVDVVLSTPKVPYRETITAEGKGHYKHKKQSGGRGQYGEVYLKVMPNAAGDDEWFDNNIVGGAIPGNFVPAVQKGLLEGMTEGCMAKFPVTNVKVSLYDGSYHDVDSSEVAFKIAASRALREAMSDAKPVLLEPIMSVKITIPDECMGDVNGDLNHKRGRILGVDVTDGGVQILTAEVPKAELFRYSAELRSITAGRGSFEMEFVRYDQVPANVAQKVVAAHASEEA